MYNINWKPLNGQRIYPLKAVLKSLGQVPAFELWMRQHFGQHFTSYKCKPYISYDLVQLMHMRHCVQQTKDLIRTLQPFEQVA